MSRKCTVLHEHAHLSESRIVNLSQSTIQDAKIDGMRINGTLVTDLLRAFENYDGMG